jgi:AmmeMemoRadiSam system protein A
MTVPVDSSADEALLALHGAALLTLARDSIAWCLENHARMVAELDRHPAELHAPRAVFVSLTEGGRLRGCVGTPVAWRSLIEDVIDNAASAAIEDQRFQPLEPCELMRVTIALSLLSAPRAVDASSEAALLARLVRGEDGLILHEGRHRALFLPQVWSHFRDPREFLAELKAKAGLPRDYWSPSLEFQTFRSVSIAETATTS